MSGHFIDIDKGFTSLSCLTCSALVRVHRERERQEELVEAGKFPSSAAGLHNSDAEKLAILTEEVGDVANVLNEIRITSWKGSDLSVHKGRLLDELIQVAAVAVAWAESTAPRELWNDDQEESYATSRMDALFKSLTLTRQLLTDHVHTDDGRALLEPDR